MDYYIWQQIGDAEPAKIGTVTDAKTYKVTGLTPKTTYKFMVSAYNGLRESEKSEAVTVTTSDIPVTAITLSINKTALEVGGTAMATVTFVPEDQTDGTPVLTSSNTDVATIDSNGAIKAVGVGTTNIVAKIDDVSSKVVTIQVYEALLEVSRLTATDTTTTGTTLTWS